MPKKIFKPALNRSNWVDGSCTVKLRAEVRPYTMKELRSLYKMSYRSFSTFLRRIQPLLGEVPGKFYNVRQVEIIFMELGIPYLINETE